MSGCGAAGSPSASAGPGRGQHLLRRRVTHAVTSSISVFPHSTAAAHSASTQGRECRTPRVPRIGHRREALQQVPAGRGPQRLGTAGQLAQGLTGGAAAGMRD